MIKDIVLNLSFGTGRDVALEYAASVANLFGAHLSGIAFAYEPLVPLSLSVGEMMPPSWIEAEQEKAEADAQRVIARFDDVTKQWGLSASSRMLTAPLGDAAIAFGQIARRFDLSVVRQSDPSATNYEDLLIEAALFESGRPTVVVPYIQTANVALDNVLVCWDGSRNSARAIADALPFLKRAKAIEILIVGTEVKSDEIPGADIAQHLARHGLNIEVKRIVAADLDVPNIILSHAADASIDFIVMGAYGHSRLREFILGGATRGMLSEMTVPTFMSH